MPRAAPSAHDRVPDRAPGFAGAPQRDLRRPDPGHERSDHGHGFEENSVANAPTDGHNAQHDHSLGSHDRAREERDRRGAVLRGDLRTDGQAGRGYFAQVQVNESLTLDFADEPEQLRTSHHCAFHVSDAEFEGIWSRVKGQQLAYGSGPSEHANGQIYTRRGGRGFYFADPDGHLLEVMTVPETGT